MRLRRVPEVLESATNPLASLLRRCLVAEQVGSVDVHCGGEVSRRNDAVDARADDRAVRVHGARHAVAQQRLDVDADEARGVPAQAVLRRGAQLARVEAPRGAPVLFSRRMPLHDHRPARHAIEPVAADAWPVLQIRPVHGVPDRVTNGDRGQVHVDLREVVCVVCADVHLPVAAVDEAEAVLLVLQADDRDGRALHLPEPRVGEHRVEQHIAVDRHVDAALERVDAQEDVHLPDERAELLGLHRGADGLDEQDVLDRVPRQFRERALE
mmetsp:Transcript_45206/g.139458  ORF Transcript_45206/g.139458 Transcript_45206/m.139458 type:complete len:269 (-) Transcript_45206:423-1229(-)